MIRRWCLTCNNYKKIDISKLKKLNYTYLLIGGEIGANKTPHLQVYVELVKGFKRLTALKKKLTKRFHIEAAKGSGLQNKVYCSKESVIFEDGKVSVVGKRNDIDRVKTMILNDPNVTLRKVSLICKNSQSLNYAKNFLTLWEKPRPIKEGKELEVIWLWGESGTGKSRYVYDHEKEEDIYRPINYKWWDGYDAHSIILLDELRGDFCKYHEMLKLLDIYPFKVECKGGSRQFKGRKIYITSCHDPTKLWGTREDITQLLRRLTKIIKVEKSVGNTVLPTIDFASYEP